MDSFAQCVYGNEPVSITLPAQSGDGGTSFTEPDYYPDYAENEDVAPAAAPAPATPGRDESDTAPKTADAPILPTLLLAALSALVLVLSAGPFSFPPVPLPLAFAPESCYPILM